MKIAQDLRAGNVIMIGKDPWVVAKAEFNKSGRNAAVMKLKLRNLLQGTMSEMVYRSDDKFEDVVLDKKEATYSYFADDKYVFMDAEYNQHEIDGETLGDSTNYLEEGMPVEVTFYNSRAITVELPTTVIRTIEYTEPSVRGDTSGKVLKVAKMAGGLELKVPAFCEIGDKIEIDTRTGEYKNRAK
jgi:elongation factor P